MCCDSALSPATGSLPPGVHTATWDEFVARYGYTPYRLTLLAGLKAALDALQLAGCRRAYIDGSFVTAKEAPGELDACWETAGVDFPKLARLAPELFNFTSRRAGQKARYGGELFPAEISRRAGSCRLSRFFQRDRHSGQPKGIVTIDLGDLP